ncbi:zinc finger protein 420 [Cryptotermes secundus]|uniref:zinc finger protein 420 n=1 Tax=Cryptotermes secundus TaxID=105785 RepID=UPI001454C174|nr:zinc finger protein 420 [Cryptotermes secundus]
MGLVKGCKTSTLNTDAYLLLQIAVCVSEEGKLRATACDSRWVLEARLADDCHSYNVVLQRGGASNTVILHVVRTIRRGEELQLWFSEQMLVALAVPFLTPLNIQVPRSYNKQDVLPPSNFQQQSSIATTAGFSHAAEMETLVSNLGRSKKGHLCIYCGKIYSRKYGLKIHIRTHTGYKPLKCKFCLRPFGDPSNLNKHVRLHAEGDTPYKCDLCGKILVRRRDLERHVKSRHSPHLDTEQHQEINKNNSS